MSALPDFDSLWDYNHPEESERQFRKLLPDAQQSGDRAYEAELLTQIARAQGLQRQFEAAHRTLDAAERLLSPDMGRAAIRYLLERGRVFNSSGDKAKAQPLFLKAWELGETAGEDFYAIDAAHMLAIIAPPDEQMAWNLKAIERAEQTTDERARGWLGSLYNNTGWTHHDAGEYEKALDIFKRALAYRQRQGNPQLIRVARWCIGRTLRSLNRIEEALAIQRELLGENESGDPDGYVYEEMGECLLLLGSDEAKGYFAQAYRLLSQDAWLAANEPARLERLRQLGGG